MKYLARRLGLYIFIFWVAITINFLLPRLMPGDPVDILIAKMKGQIDPSAIVALRQAFGLNNKGLLSGYWSYLGNLAHGNLGISISQYPSHVSTIIGSTLPWTVGLVGFATIVSFVIGTFLGILAAWRRGRLADILAPASTFLQAVPYFWLAAILILIFGVKLGWLPISNGYDTGNPPSFSASFIVSVLDHALLPAFAIIVSSLAQWLLGMRNMMVTVLGEEYVTLAQAKGLSNLRVMTSYAARNAILPSVTSFALSLGFVVGGALLTEVVFSYPGVGNALFLAVQNEDYPLMQGIFLVISITVVAANLLADLVYVLIDPRTRHEA